MWHEGNWLQLALNQIEFERHDVRKCYTMSPIAVSLIAFVIIISGAFAGTFLRKILPDHHLEDDAKEVFRLGAGLIGTIAALVLGLLIASAKGSYDTQRGQVQHITANVVLLDQLLAQYGSEAYPIRELMRKSVDTLVERIWRENGDVSSKGKTFVATTVAEDVFVRIGALSAETDAQRSLKARAIQVFTDLAETRLALFVQAGNSIPTPFLTVLVFWLAIIFASFSLFARFNQTLIVGLVVFALSASCSIFMILEMSQPFAGLMQIPGAPLRNALAPLGAMLR